MAQTNNSKNSRNTLPRKEKQKEYFLLKKHEYKKPVKHNTIALVSKLISGFHTVAQIIKHLKYTNYLLFCLLALLELSLFRENKLAATQIRFCKQRRVALTTSEKTGVKHVHTHESFN